MRVLMTGFEPFGGESINPSLMAVESVELNESDFDVVKATLPVEFGEALTSLEHWIELYHPDVVICVGQAGGRSQMTVERVGINVDDARIADNAGKSPIDKPIRADGPDAYFSNLPIKAMVEEMKKAGIPASVSNTAGTFVCNHVLYGLMDLIAQKYPQIKGGFIHVPYLPVQAAKFSDVSSMDLTLIVKALEIAALTAVRFQEDIKVTAGVEC